MNSLNCFDPKLLEEKTIDLKAVAISKLYNLLGNKSLVSIIESENFDDFYTFVLNEKLNDTFVLNLAKIVVLKNWVRALEFLIVVFGNKVLGVLIDKEKKVGLIHFALALKKTEIILLILNNMDSLDMKDSQGFSVAEWAFYFNNDILVLKKIESMGLSLAKCNSITGFYPFELSSESFLWVFAETSLWVDSFLNWKGFVGFYKKSLDKDVDVFLHGDIGKDFVLCRWCFLIGKNSLANWMAYQLGAQSKGVVHKRGVKWHLLNYIESIVIEPWEEAFFLDLFNHFKID